MPYAVTLFCYVRGSAAVLIGNNETLAPAGPNALNTVTVGSLLTFVKIKPKVHSCIHIHSP